MVSRCTLIRRRKNQRAAAARQERVTASRSAQFLAALRLKYTAAFSKKRKRPSLDSPDEPHPKRAALYRALSAPGDLNRQSPASSSQQKLPLHPCISEPVPESYLPVPNRTPAAPLPPRPSPDSRRAKKRLHEMMIHMSKQWEELIRESSEHEEDAESQNNGQLPHKGESEASQENESEGALQESVWVEKNGERLSLHLKCPCTKGYKVLLVGDDCYYTAASF